MHWDRISLHGWDLVLGFGILSSLFNGLDFLYFIFIRKIGAVYIVMRPIGYWVQAC